MPPMILLRQAAITDDDRGPIANLGAWITMISMVLVVITKLLTKLLVLGKWQRDDLLILLVMILAIVQTVTTSLQVSSGLGTRVDVVQDPDTLQKLIYAGQLLYVTTLSLTQVSLVQFEFLISKPGIRQKALKVVVCFIGLWTLASLFAIAFQCDAPAVWAVLGTKCFDQSTFWIIWTVCNCGLDIFVSLFPTALLYDVRFPLNKKLSIFGAFATRTCAIPISVLRTLCISWAAKQADLFFAELNVSLLTVVHMNITILLTCIPFLKPFLDSLQTGIWTGVTATDDVRSAIHTRVQDGINHSNTCNITGGKKRWGAAKLVQPIAMIGHELKSLPARIRGRGDGSNEHDSQIDASQSDRNRLSDGFHKPMIINQTTTIVIKSKKARR